MTDHRICLNLCCLWENWTKFSQILTNLWKFGSNTTDLGQIPPILSGWFGWRVLLYLSVHTQKGSSRKRIRRVGKHFWSQCPTCSWAPRALGSLSGNSSILLNSGIIKWESFGKSELKSVTLFIALGIGGESVSQHENRRIWQPPPSSHSIPTKNTRIFISLQETTKNIRMTISQQLFVYFYKCIALFVTQSKTLFVSFSDWIWALGLQL